MNYMVSTYNDTLFTTTAAIFSAPAAVAAPTEAAAEAAQQLTKYDSGCTKNTLSRNRCSADFLKTCASGSKIML